MTSPGRSFADVSGRGFELPDEDRLANIVQAHFGTTRLTTEQRTLVKAFADRIAAVADGQAHLAVDQLLNAYSFIVTREDPPTGPDERQLVLDLLQREPPYLSIARLARALSAFSRAEMSDLDAIDICDVVWLAAALPEVWAAQPASPGDSDAEVPLEGLAPGVEPVLLPSGPSAAEVATQTAETSATSGPDVVDGPVGSDLFEIGEITHGAMVRHGASIYPVPPPSPTGWRSLVRCGRSDRRCRPSEDSRSTSTPRSRRSPPRAALRPCSPRRGSDGSVSNSLSTRPPR